MKELLRTQLVLVKAQIGLAATWTSVLLSRAQCDPSLVNVKSNLEEALISIEVLENFLPAFPASVPASNTASANRANLTRLLEENDWNIAKVARGLGVTRRALYMRLAAFGIERKKVPRLAKPLPSSSNK